MDERKRKAFTLLLYLWLVLGMVASWPIIVTAHGSGAPRLVNVTAGPYRLWVWSLPDPIRVGEVHISIGVDEPELSTAPPNASATELDVHLEISAVDRSGQAFTQKTSKRDRFLQTYYETDFTMPAAGQWQATVTVTGPAGIGTAAFAFTVLPPQQVNWTLILWGALALVAGLGAIWAKRGPG